MRWARLLARMVEERKLYNVLMVKLEWKRQLRTLMRKWEGGIRTDVREFGWRGVEWVQLAHVMDSWRAVLNKIINFRVLELWN
jgi:hypothetical protein